MSEKNIIPHAESVMILGTTYLIMDKTTEEEPRLKNCSGFTDWSTHIIYLNADKCPEVDEEGRGAVDDQVRYMQATLAHEIIHAFRCECGASTDNWSDEDNVEWFGNMLSRIMAACFEAGAVSVYDWSGIKKAIEEKYKYGHYAGNKHGEDSSLFAL